MDFQPLTETVHHTRYTAIDPSSPANSAAGKVVAISGGAGGIALAIAHGFCIAGASVAILFARRQTALDEASEKLRKEHGTEVWTYSLDIRDGTATTSTFAAIRKRLNADGQTDDMDVLVTCAAALDQGENAIDFDTETIKKQLRDERLWQSQPRARLSRAGDGVHPEGSGSWHRAWKPEKH